MENKYAKYKEYTDWKRIGEVDTSPSLWGEKGISPAGIEQGKLGTCWFLAAASALAEYPERVEKLFVNKEYSKEGVFQIKLFKEGVQDYVTIDDNLLFRKKKYAPPVPFHTERSKKGAWWMPLLEKAASKFFVNT